MPRAFPASPGDETFGGRNSGKIAVAHERGLVSHENRL
jgi:hypothetical protein